MLSDAMPPNVRDKGTGVDFIEIWNTSATHRWAIARPPPPHCTRIRLNEFYPGHILKLPERPDGRHRMMHRARSIDYGIVLEGELYLILMTARCCCTRAM